MVKRIGVIYENSVINPLEKVELREKERIKIKIIRKENIIGKKG